MTFGSSNVFIKSGGLMLATLCILLSLLQCQANRAELEDRNLCKTLDVQHTDVPLDIDPDSVQVYLADENGEQSCYNTSISYKVTIKTTKPIFGLLILQEEGKRFGTFPHGNLNHDGLTDRFCDNSVSHRCIYNKFSERDYRKRCNLGTSLELPFLAPHDRTNTVEFRYTLVFTTKEYLENRVVKFPACPCEGEECTKKPTTCEGSEFQIQDSTEKVPVDELCPFTRIPKIKESRVVVANGVNYTCVTTAPVRKRTCESGCMTDDGRTKCCRTVDKKKMKDFLCTAPSSPPFIEQFNVIEQRRCECYYCADVCPIVPAPENSVEVEHHVTPMVGNDVVQMPSSAPESSNEEDGDETLTTGSSGSYTEEHTTSDEEENSTTLSIDTVLNSA